MHSHTFIGFLLPVVVLAAACSKTAAPKSAPAVSSPTASALPQSQLSSIRAVDFEQVEYPRYRLPTGTTTTLKGGETAPAHIIFGDVTGDNVDEALVVAGENTRGTAILHHVYVFGLVGKDLKLLLDFETCDRADGGLRQVYANEGRFSLNCMAGTRC